MRASMFRNLSLLMITAAVALTMAGEPTASAGGGACHEAPAREGSGTEVRLTRNCFSPSILRVEAGTDVTFRNDDQAVHEVISIPGLTPGETQWAGGEARALTFAAPGIYPYYCNLHYGMVGAIVVGDGKFAASTGGNGASMAVQASQPRDVSPDAPAPAPAASASTADDDPARWPLYAGLGVAVAGLMVATAVARRPR